MHYQRWLKGTPMDKFVKGTSTKYKACHLRVAKARGRASDYWCIDCGAVADEWAYNHLDPNEVRGVIGNGRSAEVVIAWSPDPKFYEPRCVGCHRRFDIGRDKAGSSPEANAAC